MEPVIRHMLLCDVVRKRTDTPLKFDLIGQNNNINPVVDFPFDLAFSVFVTMTGGRGSGMCSIRVTEADTSEVVHEGDEYKLPFTADPTRVHAATIRVRSCTFYRAGLYYVEFMYNGAELAHEPLAIKEFA